MVNGQPEKWDLVLVIEIDIGGWSKYGSIRTQKGTHKFSCYYSLYFLVNILGKVFIKLYNFDLGKDDKIKNFRDRSMKASNASIGRNSNLYIIFAFISYCLQCYELSVRCISQTKSEFEFF